MRDLFINCPDCKKLLLKGAYLRVGTKFTMKCFSCGTSISIRSESGKIICKVDREEVIKIDDDEDETVFLST